MPNTIEKIKKAVAIAGIIATTYAGGATGDYYLIKDVDLKTTRVTESQFNQMRVEYAGKFDKDKMAIDDKQMWENIADRVVKNCGGITLKNIKGENWKDAINKIILSNNCNLYAK